MPIFNYQKLKGRIIEVLETNVRFMELMNWSRPTFNRKISSESDWTTSEIWKAMQFLQIPVEQVSCYFFVTDVQKID